MIKCHFLYFPIFACMILLLLRSIYFIDFPRTNKSQFEMDANIVILEQCHVAPSPGGPAEKLLPLSDFDVIFLRFPLMQSLFFYNFRCSKSHFLETVVPKFKNSLSQALIHFSPLAGKIILPLTSAAPVSHYVAGDSIPLTFAQSDADFVHLTGNHYRDSDDFLDFVPHLPPATYLSDSIKFSVAAFQITHFPDRGACLGFTVHHSIADGASMLCFLRPWFSIIKSNDHSHLCLPSYDRTSRLSDETWNRVKKSKRMVHLAVTPRTRNLRAAFLLTDNDILQLKKFIVTNMKKTKNVSTFVIVCAYLWTCFAKSAGPEEAGDDEVQYLACPGDCRARLDPPLPDNYFGNCIAFMVAESTHGRLRRKDGIVEAVVAIEEAIRKTFNNRGGVDISGYQEFKKLDRRRVFLIAGSTRYDQAEGDFVWGRPKKVETMNVDSKESVSLGRSVDPEGIEIGLSMSKVEMDAFVAVFEQGIRESSARENIFLSKI